MKVKKKTENRKRRIKVMYSIRLQCFFDHFAGRKTLKMLPAPGELVTST